MDEALGLFATQGYANTSVAEIAERIGFTKAALYYHFRSKDEVLLELLTPLLDDLDDLTNLPVDASSEAGYKDAFARYLTVMHKHGPIVGVLTNDVSAMTHPAVAGRAMPAFQRFRSMVAGPDAPLDRLIAIGASLSAVTGALQVVPEPDDEQRDLILRIATAAMEVGSGQR